MLIKMKIKIIHYPYQEHKIGDIVDLGEELNKSPVSFDRAVWIESSSSIFSRPAVATETKKTVKAKASKKKLITNTLQEQVQQAKKDEGIIAEEPKEPEKPAEEVEVAPTKKQSFWDKLKWKSAIYTPKTLEK